MQEGFQDQAALGTEMLQGAVVEAGSVIDALRDLPIGAHSVAITGLLVGLAIWAFGRSFVKPGFALVGIVLGAASGFFVIASLPIFDSLPIPAPYLGLGIGAMAGLLISVLLFRVVMAASTALIMAVIGVLAAATYLDLKLEPKDPEQNLSTEQMTLDGPEQTEVWTFGEAEEDPGQAERVAMSATLKTRRFIRALSARLTDLWERLPEQSQLVVSLSAALGAAVGALSGIGAPKRAAGAVTAMLGAAMWVPCAIWLVHVKDVPGRDFLMERGPLGYTMIWLGVSAVGIMIQWIAIRRAGEQPASEND